MAGKSCCGGGTGGAPRIDPQDCNALTTGPAGLLVPETDIIGLAPGGNVSTERSVDIDVTPPADGACPEVWTIGARLTPVSGQTDAGSLDLGPDPGDTWKDMPGVIVLPEAGTYALDASVRATIEGDGPVQGWVSARLFDATTGAAVPLSDTLIGLINENSTDRDSFQATSPIQVLYQVNGPRTIRVQGLRHTTFGTLHIAQIVSGAQGYSTLRFTKVSD